MKLLKRTLALFLILIMIISNMTYYVSAIEFPSKGYVNGVSVRLRSGAGTDSSIVSVTNHRQSLTITGQATANDGSIWYAVTMDTGESGYIHSDYVEIQVEYVPSDDFEAYLQAQGFPESYKVKLREMHAVHPEWVFLADHIDLTWQEALALQTPLGTSLIHWAYPEAFRTMKAGAYDWHTGSYVSLDSGSWYAAHEDVIAYYLDPRNFLNTGSVFQFVGLSFNENVHTKEALQSMLVGTFMEGAFPEAESGYSTWADVIFAAAKTHNMSPYALASMILTEQGTNGVGKLISGTESGYEGYYNFLSIKAYANDGKTAVQNGLEYAMGSGNFSRPWNNRVSAIFGGAEFYTHEYIKNAQDTLYYKKFNVVSPPLGMHQYMTNIVAAEQEGIESSESYKVVLGKELVFNIPVYKDMPETAIAEPNRSGNNNFYLSSLSVGGYSLSPTFNLYTNTYEIVVDGSVSSVNVSATASDSGASVSGIGDYWLSEGKNTIQVSVTSTSSKVNTYTLIIYREGSGSQNEVTFNKDAYSFSDTSLYFVPASTTADVLKANLAVRNGSVSIVSPSGVEKTGTLATGDIVRINRADGSNYVTYSLAINGDVSGDGKISLIDLAKIQRHLLSIETVNGINAVAADVSGDGKVSLIDLAKVQRHLLSIETIN